MATKQTPEFLKEQSARFKAARAKAGITRQKLRDELLTRFNLSATDAKLTNYELGRTAIPSDLLRPMAIVLGVKVEALLPAARRKS